MAVHTAFWVGDQAPVFAVAEASTIAPAGTSPSLLVLAAVGRTTIGEVAGVQAAATIGRPSGAPMLVLCNVTNKILKRTDTAVAFTQEYSRVSYPLRNMSTLFTGSGSSKGTHAGVEKTEERTS